MTADATKSSPRGWTRRDWLKAGGIAGISGVVGAAIGTEVIAPLLGPPVELNGEIRADFVYTASPTPQWWDTLVGQAVRVTDLAEWQGATAVWRGLFRDGGLIRQTGFPVLVIRVKREDTYLKVPEPFTAPPGYAFFYDDSARDLRIIVVYSRCTHLCCYTSWHALPPGTPIVSNYFAPSPTREVYGQIPIYCICHDAQYDPLVLAPTYVPWGTFSYLGASAVGGPARFGLPVVPVQSVGDVLLGGMGDPRWYAYC